MLVVPRRRTGEDHTVTTDASTAAQSPHGVHGGGRRRWLVFSLHVIEMLVVMFAGMGILGLVMGMPHDSPIAVQALWMTATMTVPMVGWMLFRGHSRRASLEMAAAMGSPLLVLLPALGARLTSADAILDLTHVAMLPTMLGAMLIRRTEYGL